MAKLDQPQLSLFLPGARAVQHKFLTLKLDRKQQCSSYQTNTHFEQSALQKTAREHFNIRIAYGTVSYRSELSWQQFSSGC